MTWEDDLKMTYALRREKNTPMKPKEEILHYKSKERNDCLDIDKYFKIHKNQHSSMNMNLHDNEFNYQEKSSSLSMI